MYSVAMWRAVVTVDWTTKKSAPASSAILAKRSAREGMEETTTGPPPFLISEIFLWISSSLDRLAVDPLDDLGRLVQAGGGDAVEHLVGILVAGKDPLEVQDREAAEAAHLDGEPGADHTVHGGGDHRDLRSDARRDPRRCPPRTD